MKKEKTILSVVIPAYNAGKYIKNCINSINVVTENECEIIVVEDKNISMNLNNILDFSSLNI